MINIDNFDEYGRTKPIIDSPRSLEACKRQGIQPMELIIRQLHHMKQIYKDGMNDRKSLQTKLDHYEMRRRKKVQLIREQRNKIIETPPKSRACNSNRYETTKYRDVEDKLEKKRIMDEVKEEIKRKQVEIKDIETQNKLRAVEQKKLEHKAFNRQKQLEKEARKNANLIHNEMDKMQKINNWMEVQQEKEWKVRKAEEEKSKLIQQKKRQKEEYYHEKASYANNLKNYHQSIKEQKFKVKQNYLLELKTDQQKRDIQYKKSLDQQRKKDNEWKECRKKQAEIEQRHRQEQIWNNIKAKQFKKDTVLTDLQKRKEQLDENTKEDKQKKAALVKLKQQQDQFQLEKRRKIMEYREKLIAQQQQRREEEVRIANKLKAEQRKQKQKNRMFILQQKDKQEYLKKIFIEERYQERGKEIEQKQKQRQQKQKEKALMKRLKEQQAQENAKRRQIISNYEKQQELRKYEQKMKAIQEERSKAKLQVKVKPANRSQIESKIYSEKRIADQKGKQNEKLKEKQKANYGREQKQQSNKVVSLQKEKKKLKKEQIRKLIENFKIQVNREEFKMMQEEEQVEKERKLLEETAQNVAELKRLQKIHGVERARFQEQLNRQIKRNQERVAAYERNLDSQV